MIVVVGDGGVEDHASEQFGTVDRWLVGPAAQAVGHQRVRPALAVLMAVAAVQDGQPTDKAKALVSLAGAIVHVLPVEALQHQHVTFIANFLQPRLGDVEATAARKLKRGKFDALHVEAVTAGRKLAEPIIVVTRLAGLARALWATRRFKRLAVQVCVGVGNGFQGFVEAKRPQNGEAHADCRARLAQLQRSERVAVDASFGSEVSD